MDAAYRNSSDKRRLNMIEVMDLFSRAHKWSLIVFDRSKHFPYHRAESGRTPEYSNDTLIEMEEWLSIVHKRLLRHREFVLP